MGTVAGCRGIVCGDCCGVGPKKQSEEAVGRTGRSFMGV